MPDAELAAWLRLTLVPGLGGQGLRKLLGDFGLPSQVLAAGRAALARSVGDALAERILADDSAAAVDAALRWVEAPDRSIVTLADAAYPQQLLEISDPPALLYVLGDAALLARRGLAIVGSRNATPQGTTNAERFARAFSDAGLTIASGLALGIDAAAHRGALGGAGSTVAVLGCGVDVVYPQRNADLYQAVAARGALVSEFPLGSPPLAANFPRRNRLISGLARGVLVVEAALAQRLADHRPPRRRAGTRGVRHPGIDPLAAVEGLPRADQGGRETGRERAGRARRVPSRRARGRASARASGKRHTRCSRTSVTTRAMLTPCASAAA